MQEDNMPQSPIIHIHTILHDLFVNKLHQTVVCDTPDQKTQSAANLKWLIERLWFIHVVR